MIRNYRKKQEELRQVRYQLNHLGACTTAGKTDKEIAQLDERFFLACERVDALKAGLQQKQNQGV